MKKRLKIMTLSLAGAGFISCGCANSVNFNLDVGTSFAQLSNNAYLSPAAGLTNAYNANEGVQKSPFFGLGAEYNFDHFVSAPVTLGLGLSAYYIGLGNISGTETPFINGGLTDTLNYTVQAQSFALMFEPRLTYTAYRLQPYIFGGLGYAWNTLSGFAESVPAGSNAAPMDNPYSNHTEGNFAYEAGLGMQYALWQNQSNGLLLKLEYRYFNLGRAQLGTAVGQTTGERLTVNNTSANILDFGLAYQFK